MYGRSDVQNIAEMLPIFFAILIGMGIIFWIIFVCVKKQDNNKALITKNVKVLEKPVQQGNIEWYVVECENGDRLKLRSFNANRLFISVGDVGEISFKGKTIQDFKRKN